MKISVYLGSSVYCKEEYNELAFEVGRKLAEAGHTIIYGGADVGTMRYLADGAQSAGGTIIGVFPKDFKGTADVQRMGLKVLRDGLNEMLITKDFAERKQKMEDLCDCSLVLPGSFGTLDELFTFACNRVIGKNSKQIYVLNHKGFYTPLINLLENASSAGFIKPDTAETVIFCDTADEFLSCIPC